MWQIRYPKSAIRKMGLRQVKQGFFFPFCLLYLMIFQSFEYLLLGKSSTMVKNIFSKNEEKPCSILFSKSRNPVFFMQTLSMKKNVILYTHWHFDGEKNWIVESLEVYFFPHIPAIAHWPASATIAQIWLQMRQYSL